MAYDAEIEEHKAWLGFLQPVGLVVAPHALKAKGAVLSRDTAELQAALQRVAPAGDDEKPRFASFAGFAREVLGWPIDQLAGALGGPALPDIAVALPEYGETLRPTHALLDADNKPILVVWELPAGTDFDRVPEGRDGWHTSPLAKLERLLRERDGARATDGELLPGLLSNCEALRLVVAPRGESSGHVTFPIAPMLTVAGRPLLAALSVLLSAERLLHVPPDRRLPQLLRESRKYQNQVSTALAEQVLGALWELLRGLQAADVQSSGKILSRLARSDPDHIYGGLLTVVMRLVFVLYAEHRELFPNDPAFRENYSLGGLFERLRADAGAHPDTMDQRYGGWAALLTLFRLLHRGGAHPGRFSLPARHGELFDPQRFPFLEGTEHPHDTVERFDAPRVSDGCVLRVLQALMVLDGERLSYRTLDVEQIGSVYEAMMGFKVGVARARSLAVGIGSRKPDVIVDLEELLAQPADKRAKWLKETTGCDLTEKAEKALKQADTLEELTAALDRRRSKFVPDPMPPGALFLQPTEERRRSGTHYTPRELTGPIVETTFRPVFDGLGPNPLPEQILSLKVCDPAMGSGAFLVEACRQLAERLVRAWEAHGGVPPLPADEDALLHARRLVAQRCLYGVDRNPFAVGLAKLSLWLVTLANDHAFTFLDHALKHGDSLVGLTREQIRRFHWSPEADDGPLFAAAVSEAKEAAKLRANIGVEHEGDEARQRLDLRSADEAVEAARRAGDLALLAFFDNEKKQRHTVRLLVRDRLERAAEDEAIRRGLDDELRERRRRGPPFVPFHWEIEFPEVFERSGGFDAIVGNPPFAGKNTIKAANGESYIPWLQSLHDESHGNADLVAHFFRRAFGLLRAEGAFGLIATNTIAQGDTRASGLRWILKHGGAIYEAKRRHKWPLPGAAVIVSVVHVVKGVPRKKPRLDERDVDRISAFLFHRGGDDDPQRLAASMGHTFQGSIVLGQGFVFDDADTSGEANPLSAREDLVKRNPANAERIFPYLGGEEIYDSPIQSTNRFVINFGEMTEHEVRLRWPDLLDVVERKVKPRRLAQNRQVRARYWWRFGESTPALFRAIAGKAQIIVNPMYGNHLCFVFTHTEQVFTNKVNVTDLESSAAFATLQSRVHEVWARFFSATIEDRIAYAPSDCFETFPFPPDWERQRALESAGTTYYDYRAALMVDHGEGLSKTYNRFHDPDEHDPRVHQLRRLHDAMDRAVLDTYGWTDLTPQAVFELEYEIDEEEYSGRKKPWRYRWPEAMRDEVLARLLELNEARAKEEQLSGVAAKPTEPKPTKEMKPKKVRRPSPSSNRDFFKPESEE